MIFETTERVCLLEFFVVVLKCYGLLFFIGHTRTLVSSCLTGHVFVFVLLHSMFIVWYDVCFLCHFMEEFVGGMAFVVSVMWFVHFLFSFSFLHLFFSFSGSTFVVLG